MGGKRWWIIAVVVVLAGGVVALTALASRDSGMPESTAIASDASDGDSAGAANSTAVTSLPTPSATGAVDAGGAETAPSGNLGGAAGQPGTEPGATSGAPPPPPPQPPPSPPNRPEPVPCTVSVLAGPMPGVPNIRIVVTAETRVDMLWASVREGSRNLQGAIALAGGRGEQIVEGVSQGARVTIYSDPSMSDLSQSCSNVMR